MATMQPVHFPRCCELALAQFSYSFQCVRLRMCLLLCMLALGLENLLDICWPVGLWLHPVSCSMSPSSTSVWYLLQLAWFTQVTGFCQVICSWLDICRTPFANFWLLTRFVSLSALYKLGFSCIVGYVAFNLNLDLLPVLAHVFWLVSWMLPEWVHRAVKSWRMSEHISARECWWQRHLYARGNITSDAYDGHLRLLKLKVRSWLWSA